MLMQIKLDKVNLCRVTFDPHLCLLSYKKAEWDHFCRLMTWSVKPFSFLRHANSLELLVAWGWEWGPAHGMKRRSCSLTDYNRLVRLAPLHCNMKGFISIALNKGLPAERKTQVNANKGSCLKNRKVEDRSCFGVLSGWGWTPSVQQKHDSKYKSLIWGGNITERHIHVPWNYI